MSTVAIEVLETLTSILIERCRRPLHSIIRLTVAKIMPCKVFMRHWLWSSTICLFLSLPACGVPDGYTYSVPLSDNPYYQPNSTPSDITPSSASPTEEVDPPLSPTPNPPAVPSFDDPVASFDDELSKEVTSEANADAVDVTNGALVPLSFNKAENVLLSTLKDPYSAHLTNVLSDKRTGAVCGVVNAKNGFGAYTGGSPFVVYYSHKYSSIQVVTSDVTEIYIQGFCGG